MKSQLQNLSKLIYASSMKLLIAIGCMFFSQSVHTMTCNPCLASIGESVWTLCDRLLATQCVGTTIRQSDVPFTITEPGIYSLCEDLLSTAPGSTIVINSDDVLLNLACHAITVTQVAAGQHIGININGNRVAVGNGRMIAQEDPAAGLANVRLISMSGVREVIVDNINFFGTSDPESGFDIGSTAIGVGTNSTNVVVHDCTVENIAVGTLVGTATQVIISKCKFENTQQVGVFCNVNPNGILVEDCLFVGGRFMRVFGGNNITMRRCVGSQATIGSSAIALDATANTPSSNIIISDCIVNGTTDVGQDGIVVLEVTGVIIENCLVNNTAGNGMTITGTDIVVRGCTVNCADGDGINVAGSSFNVFVQNCEVANSTGSNFVGVNPVVITSGVSSTTASNYWMDVSLP